MTQCMTVCDWQLPEEEDILSTPPSSVKADDSDSD